MYRKHISLGIGFKMLSILWVMAHQTLIIHFYVLKWAFSNLKAYNLFTTDNFAVKNVSETLCEYDKIGQEWQNFTHFLGDS